jgi:hypothetical protein
MKKLCVFFFSILFALSLLIQTDISARTKSIDNNWKQKPEDKPERSTAIFELRKSTKSNFDFCMTNSGILGLNTQDAVGGGFWPRGTQNQYLFGSGLWFAAIKKMPGDTVNKLVVLSYNPNSGYSWFIPGSLDDGDKLAFTKKDMYRLYFSSDYDKSAGQASKAEGGPSWPLWKGSESSGFAGSFFVNDTSKRNTTSYPSGPAIYSDEDMFAIFKDTDLTRYDTTQKNYADRGYPLRTEIQQTVFSWGNESYKDMIIIMYKLINRSPDTLYKCYLAPVFDFDLARSSNAQQGATNDRLRYYNEEDTLNLAVMWTNTDQGEKNNRFGYAGVALLATPTPDDNGFISSNVPLTDKSGQIGLATFRNWVLADDKLNDVARFD